MSMPGLVLFEKVESLQFLTWKIFCISLIDFLTASELTKGPKNFSPTACFVLWNKFQDIHDLVKNKYMDKFYRLLIEY